MRNAMNIRYVLFLRLLYLFYLLRIFMVLSIPYYSALIILIMIILMIILNNYLVYLSNEVFTPKKTVIRLDNFDSVIITALFQ